MKIVEVPRHGPMFRFSDYHVYKTLNALSDGRRKGRKRLADTAGIGEGSMRKIIEVLREREYIEVRQTGVRLTQEGIEYLRGIPIEVARIDPGDISLGEENVAVLVRDSVHKVRSGLEQRDQALRAGATGATTVLVKGGRLIIPEDYDLDENDPAMAGVLRELFDIGDRDIIIIGTAETVQDAENGGLAAAFDII